MADGSAALSTNLKAYTDGVANASAGSDDVMDGIAKLQSGITGLESGLVDLKTQSADGCPTWLPRRRSWRLAWTR